MLFSHIVQLNVRIKFRSIFFNILYFLLQCVYIAPLKALVHERVNDWKKKFEQQMGIRLNLLFFFYQKIKIRTLYIHIVSNKMSSNLKLIILLILLLITKYYD